LPQAQRVGADQGRFVINNLVVDAVAVALLALLDTDDQRQVLQFIGILNCRLTDCIADFFKLAHSHFDSEWF